MVSNQPAISVSSWDGTLSPSDFHVSASAFAENWQKYNSALHQWSWVSCSKQSCVAAYEVNGYLSLENVFFHTPTEGDHNEQSRMGKEKPSCSDKEEFVDPAILVQSYGQEVHCYDFHVLYSSSYRVPVLYFHAYCSDGQPLALDVIEKDLPASSAKILMESKWTFITEEEHPYLNRPWYSLHPCGTSEWMKLLFTNDASVDKVEVAMEQYLVSWFSVVGQVVGLKMPLEMLSNLRQL